MIHDDDYGDDNSMESVSETTTTATPTNLQALKESINLVDLIESQYALPHFVRHGPDKATALCPFHDDHNPSLSIQRNMVRCFACGAAGDVFYFVRAYNRSVHHVELSFYDAVRLVQQQQQQQPFATTTTTTSTSTSSSSSSGTTRVEHAALFAANAAAALFYQTALTQPAAGGVRNYLRSRHLKPDTIRAFGGGYADHNCYSYGTTSGKSKSSSLVDHLQTLGFAPQEIVEAGLATVLKSRRENNGSFSFCVCVCVSWRRLVLATPRKMDSPFSSLSLSLSLSHTHTPLFGLSRVCAFFRRYGTYIKQEQQLRVSIIRV
jgi:DNA primase